ncbi:MAG: prepilin-type N-terminal cleavage/methylation domain-containing protein [Planctomycetota bacterium]
MSKTKVYSHNKGFTLVELLVVIAIIAVLLSILVPALNKVRNMAMKVVCASNEKQIGLAFNLYTHDYDDHLPPAVQGTEGFTYDEDAPGGMAMHSWDRVIEPYVASTLKNKGEDREVKGRDIFACLADKLERATYQDTYEFVDVRRKRSYSMVVWDAPWPYWHQSQRIAEAKQPAERFLVSEWFGHTNGRWLHWYSAITQSMYLWGYRNYDPPGYFTPSPFESDYHGRGSNFLFLDFHVKWMPAIEAIKPSWWGWDTTFSTRKRTPDTGFKPG